MFKRKTITSVLAGVHRAQDIAKKWDELVE